MTGAQLTRLEFLLCSCSPIRRSDGASQTASLILRFNGDPTLLDDTHERNANELAALVDAIRKQRRKEIRDNKSLAQRKRRHHEREKRKAEAKEILRKRAAKNAGAPALFDDSENDGSSLFVWKDEWGHTGEKHAGKPADVLREIQQERGRA